MTGTTEGKEYEIKVSMIVSGVEKAIGTYEFTGADGNTACEPCPSLGVRV